MREVTSSSMLGSGPDTSLHFGLGSANPESLRVVWPNGTTNTFEDVPVGQVFNVGFATGGAVAAQGQTWIMVVFSLILLLVMAIPVWRASLAKSARESASAESE